jgi:hypothetical protein
VLLTRYIVGSVTSSHLAAILLLFLQKAEASSLATILSSNYCKVFLILQDKTVTGYLYLKSKPFKFKSKCRT